MSEDYLKAIAKILNDLSIDDHYDQFKSQIVKLLKENAFSDSDLKSIKKALKPLLNKEISKFWNETTQAYEDVVQVVNTHWAEMGPEMSMDSDRLAGIGKVAKGYLGDYERSTVKKIAKAVAKGQLNNGTWRTVAKEISKLDDVSKHYANTIARTQVKAVSRSALVEKAKRAGVDWYKYTGIKRDSIRTFCLQHLNKHYTLAQIQAMRNGNREPVELYAGGWNCIHDWLPDPFYKP
ncbi:MAG: hypothetical protein H8E26_14210 [FCB group bacterium]|nr:hypothetical protein [FCB group bacterium]MBL7027438.1 hypothetical protein [Candidatus Neomarinimicrobiota bacterium]